MDQLKHFSAEAVVDNAPLRELVNRNADGRRIRLFTLVDDFSRECLALEVDTSLSGQHVSRILEALRLVDRLPGTIVCDNGTEFTSKAMLKWSMDKGIKLNFIEPGKPTQNAFIQSFNGKLRQECLRQHQMMKNLSLTSHWACVR